VAVLLLGAVAWIAGRSFAAPPYHGPRTDHFDGERFHNLTDTEHGAFGLAFWRWQWTRKPGPWGDHPDAPFGPPPPRRVGRGELRVTFVNHSTVLIQMDGLNILTDPIWSERASPLAWLGPRRRRPPGIRFEDLPPIDAVLVSHNHYDHLDVPTLRRLAAVYHPRIVSGLGNRALFAEKGIPGAVDLDWGQEVFLSRDVRVIAVPARHFSQRGFGDRSRTLWAGFVLVGPGGPVYFAGDTGFGPHFERIHHRFGPLRLALLPIGGFRPEWFMAPVHMSPADALRADHLLEARTSVAIHFGTFPLADDGETEPPDRLAELLASDPQRFWVLAPGEGRDVPP
jgi:L-ascorbate metabolism protein UlaG (beta-lactamase superfamily)